MVYASVFDGCLFFGMFDTNVRYSISELSSTEREEECNVYDIPLYDPTKSREKREFPMDGMNELSELSEWMSE